MGMTPQLPARSPSGPEVVIDLAAGAGIAFMTFLAPIPGLLPVVGLLLAAGVLLMLPLLLLGLVAGLLAAPVLLLVRLIRRR
jgi:hypothetical protein